jgi:hypothetical protein
MRTEPATSLRTVRLLPQGKSKGRAGHTLPLIARPQKAYLNFELKDHDRIRSRLLPRSAFEMSKSDWSDFDWRRHFAPSLMVWTAPPRRRQSASDVVAGKLHKRGGASMKKFIRIGIDFGKKYFHIHALRNEAGEAIERKVTRTGLVRFFAGVEPCLVGMEACGSAHHWARELTKMGFEIKLMPPAYVKP